MQLSRARGLLLRSYNSPLLSSGGGSLLAAPRSPRLVLARPVGAALVLLAARGMASPAAAAGAGAPAAAASAARIRADGVRILHDPFAPGMAEKYGAPGATDDEGFDPYADTVGPGIYGGVVRRDEAGNVVIGAQYQGHNPRPGPVYAGGGYTPTSRLLSAGDAAALGAWLDRHPDLANEVSTGGATPLHVCGMSRAAAALAALVIERGGALEAVDTYGFRPLHRMASNNLAVGARALLEAGADADALTEGGRRGETALDIARASGAKDVVALLQGAAKLQPHHAAKGRAAAK